MERIDEHIEIAYSERNALRGTQQIATATDSSKRNRSCLLGKSYNAEIAVLFGGITQGSSSYSLFLQSFHFYVDIRIPYSRSHCEPVFFHTCIAI